jgi:hypothetical protein
MMPDETPSNTSYRENGMSDQDNMAINRCPVAILPSAS